MIWFPGYPGSIGCVIRICAVAYGYNILKHNYQSELRMHILDSNFPEIERVSVGVLKSAVLKFKAMVSHAYSRAHARFDSEICDFCEPECSDMPPGCHHPNCSLYSLSAE